MAKRYIKISPFYNRPSTAGPLSAERLNAINDGLEAVDTYKIDVDAIVNNGVTTVEGTVLDGRMGKTLQDQVNTLNNNLANIYEAVVSGTLSTTEQSIGSITVPPGTYIIYATVNMAGITFVSFHVRTGDGNAIVASTNGSSKAIVFKQFNTETIISLNATGSGTITADIRYNAIRAIRLK